MLNLPAGPGIGQVIADSLALKSACRSVNASLDVYPAGQVAHRALEVLRSDALSQCFHTLEANYDYVLIDTAPVNLFPDAQVLAGVVKDVVLVAHTDQTPREAVAQAKKRLEAGGGKLAGVVLNLRTYPIPKFLYQRI